jgi:hypothetical protein
VAFETVGSKLKVPSSVSIENTLTVSGNPAHCTTRTSEVNIYLHTCDINNNKLSTTDPVSKYLLYWIPNHIIATPKMPDEMQAMVQTGGDAPTLTKQQIPKPRPAAHQMLVKISHVAQNPTDSK